MDTYKGVDRRKNKEIFNFIDTFHNLARENFEQFLETDEALQKLVKNYHLKISLYKTAFNLGIYAMFYSISLILTQG